jgi:hypothetical protein
LRKGSQKNKQAILYEVIAENTAEERTSERRRGEPQKSPPSLTPLRLIYGQGETQTQRAAENSSSYSTEPKEEKQED